MIKEMMEFAKRNKLSPFNKYKTSVRQTNNIFKTADARAIYNKTLLKLSENFFFPDSACLFNFFSFSDSEAEIKRRQEFFSRIAKSDSGFLKDLKTPRQTWKPKYDIVVVTEAEDTFLQLRELGCPVQLISPSEDLSSLQECDIIQVLDCENPALEQLPQTVFLNSIEEVYLERYLEILSGWKENLQILDNVEDFREIVSWFRQLLVFIDNPKAENLSLDYVNSVLEEVNENIMVKIKEMTLSGDSLVGILSKSKFPEEIKDIISQEVKNSGLPRDVLNLEIPVSIDERELTRYIREQNSTKFTNSAESLRKYSKELRQVPEMLEKLSEMLLIYDFNSGLSKFISGNMQNISPDFVIENSKNIFLENPQPVSFSLDSQSRCSILTGANSGGKTTLLEHIIQLIVLQQIGLQTSGNVRMPLFSDIYYFAKNKGSMSKGAFETLLTQMSEIKVGKNTLILADEMEAVTEPGAAGSIICTTAKFFINRGCFMVIATHLGQEIAKNIPFGARIDGIEAVGLDANNELIVNHNPVLGRLANSTPELIVERLAKKFPQEYFKFLHDELSRRK